MLIRYLKLSEIPALAERAVTFHESSASVMIVPKIFAAHWKTIYETGTGVILVADDFGGALGAVAIPDAQDGVLTAIECFWYVEPKYRGYGMELLKAFEEWAELLRCKRIIVAHMMDSFPERLTKIYRRRGYAPLEIHYRKEL